MAMTTRRMVECLRQDHQVELIRVAQPRTVEVLPEVVEHVFPGMSLPLYRELRAGFPARRRLLALWRQQPPDLVHVITEGPLGWSAVAAAQRLRVPVISDFHTNFHEYAAHYGFAFFQTLALRYLRRLHNATRLTLVPTRSLAESLRTRGFARLAVLARGVDTALFTPGLRSGELRRSWGAGSEQIVLLFVSRLAPEKNLALALRAYAEARQRLPGVRMVIVGDGPERDRLRAAYPDVHFAGMQRGHSLAEHYASADVFIFPSLSETFGNVTLEAMASGLAVVAFDYAAAREHVIDGVNGRAVPCADADHFVRAVHAVAAQPTDMRRMGNAARMTALRLDWASICQRYRELIVQVLQDPGQESALPHTT